MNWRYCRINLSTTKSYLGERSFLVSHWFASCHRFQRGPAMSQGDLWFPRSGSRSQVSWSSLNHICGDYLCYIPLFAVLKQVLRNDVSFHTHPHHTQRLIPYTILISPHQGAWRSKPTPCLGSHIRHQRHPHSRAAFCEPFINAAHSFGAQNYSLSSLLSHSSQGLIINGSVKQYTACCILIQ